MFWLIAYYLFMYPKKITRECHLLDPRWNGIFLIMSQRLFLLPRESNPSEKISNPGQLAST